MKGVDKLDTPDILKTYPGCEGMEGLKRDVIRGELMLGEIHSRMT